MVGWRGGETLLVSMEASFIPQSSHLIMVDDDVEEDVGYVSSSSSSSSSSEENSANSIASSSSDFMEDATSSSSSSSTLSLCAPASGSDQLEEGPLYEMSALIAQLPFKRGLSEHFNGKSQSFTSLANVRCVEDLAKPERPYNKRLKSSKSYGWGLDGHKPLSPRSSSKAISKKSSKGRRQSFLGSKASRASTEIW